MHHRYGEAHKGNPETESHHSRIYSAQKFQIIIYIPIYTSRIPNQTLFSFSLRKAHTSPLALVAISDARAASASRRGMREQRVKDRTKAGAFRRSEISPLFLHRAKKASTSSERHQYPADSLQKHLINIHESELHAG